MSKLNLMRHIPPMLQWCGGASHFSLLEIKCDQGSQTVLARLTSDQIFNSPYCYCSEADLIGYKYPLPPKKWEGCGSLLVTGNGLVAGVSCVRALYRLRSSVQRKPMHVKYVEAQTSSC
ncbi:hypothetical protein TNCV_824551 [Trichonephila clavipes]|nr:hypothetical protein TNCV_824551 [Trichonephila clavipes]